MRERGEGEDGLSELEGGRGKGVKSGRGENLAVAIRRRKRRSRRRRRRMPEIERQLQSVLRFHTKDYSSQITQFGRATKRSREGHNQKKKRKKKNLLEGKETNGKKKRHKRSL